MILSCGVFTTFIFLQMWLLSLPVALFMGDMGSGENPGECETLIVGTAKPVTSAVWCDIDPRIVSAKPHALPHDCVDKEVVQVHAVTIPRFAPFSDVVRRLSCSEALSQARVTLLGTMTTDLNTSGSQLIPVKLVSPESGFAEMVSLLMNDLSGCSIIDKWTCPADPLGKNTWHLLIVVQARHLFSLIRACPADCLRPFPSAQVYHTF